MPENLIVRILTFPDNFKGINDSITNRHRNLAIFIYSYIPSKDLWVCWTRLLVIENIMIMPIVRTLQRNLYKKAFKNI